MPLGPEPQVIVLPHDPGWARAFEAEAAKIRAALGPLPITLHHIGSTAVVGILAKPIIDLLGVVADLVVLDARQSVLEALGYEAMGAFGIDGRRYYRKIDRLGRRTHHLHVFETGSSHIERHLAFRDYLRAHAEVAQSYSDLKARLVAQDDLPWDHYVGGKDPFVRRVEADALRWWRSWPDKAQ